jgi:hypothetical protein
VVLGLLVTLAACAPGTDPPGAGPSGSDVPGSAGPSATSSPPSASAGAERKGDLVHGVMTLEGILERTPHCLMLRVGAVRWELLETSTELRDGAAARVRGHHATAVREGCTADRAVVVSSIRAR